MDWFKGYSLCFQNKKTSCATRSVNSPWCVKSQWFSLKVFGILVLILVLSNCASTVCDLMLETVVAQWHQLINFLSLMMINFQIILPSYLLDAASCSLGRVSCSSKHGNNTTERSQLLKSVQDGNSSKALQKEVEVKTTSACQQAVFRGEEKANQDVSKDSPLLLETDKDSDAGTHMDQDNKLAKRLEEESSHEEKDKISQGNSDGVQRASSSPQFCLKHQRWVKSILQQCPDECSEELQLQARVSLSPLLFQSSSSVTSSQDLTPSNLVPPAQTSTYPQIAKACEQANPEDKLSSRMESNISQMEPLLQPSSPTDTPLPALLLPVVRLVDIASVRGTFHASSNPFTASSNKLAASISSPHTLSSIHYYTSNAATHPETTKNCTFDQSDTFSPINPVNPTQLQSGYPGAPISTSSQPPTKKKKSFSRLSRKFRRACATKRQSQAQDRSNQNPVAEKIKMVPTAFLTNGPSLDDFTVSWPPTQDASTSKSGTSSPVSSPHQNHLSSSSLSSSLLSLSQQVSQIGIISHFQSSLPCTVASFTFNPNNMADGSETTSVQRDQLRLSLPSQAVLLQSKLLQPYVSLNRLSSQDCHQMTKGRSSTRHVEEEAEEDVDSSFDLHVLYSSYSSSSSEDSRVCDPDYKPRINKKRLLLEYEAARNPIHT